MKYRGATSIGGRAGGEWLFYKKNFKNVSEKNVPN